jgi:hypothetical protein
VKHADGKKGRKTIYGTDAHERDRERSNNNGPAVRPSGIGTDLKYAHEMYCFKGKRRLRGAAAARRMETSWWR